jgi:predicted dehydrogenase
MNLDKRIRVGIVGAGEISGHHIRGYLQAGEFAQVTAIADIDAERAHRRVEAIGNAEVFVDYREMIASPLVDAIDICLPHQLHSDAIVAAAAAGKHILCEKPLCLTLEEADVVTDAVATAGVTLMCAHNQLFLPAVAPAR